MNGNNEKEEANDDKRDTIVKNHIHLYHPTQVQTRSAEKDLSIFIPAVKSDVITNSGDHSSRTRLAKSMDDSSSITKSAANVSRRLSLEQCLNHSNSNALILPSPIHSLAAKGDLDGLKKAIARNRAQLFDSSALSTAAPFVLISSDKNSFQGAKENCTLFSIDIRNRYGMTALHGACYFGRLEVAQYLLDEGADINAYSQFRAYTRPPPKAISPSSPYLTKLEESRSQGAKKWATALHFAASCGHKSVIQLLLERNVDTTLVDYRGYTAAQVARMQHHKKTAAMIEEFMAHERRELIIGSGGTFDPLRVPTGSNSPRKTEPTLNLLMRSHKTDANRRSFTKDTQVDIKSTPNNKVKAKHRKSPLSKDAFKPSKPFDEATPKAATLLKPAIYVHEGSSMDEKDDSEQEDEKTFSEPSLATRDKTVTESLHLSSQDEAGKLSHSSLDSMAKSTPSLHTPTTRTLSPPPPSVDRSPATSPSDLPILLTFPQPSHRHHRPLQRDDELPALYSSTSLANPSLDISLGSLSLEPRSLGVDENQNRLLNHLSASTVAGLANKWISKIKAIGLRGGEASPTSSVSVHPSTAGNNDPSSRAKSPPLNEQTILKEINMRADGLHSSSRLHNILPAWASIKSIMHQPDDSAS